MMVSLCWLVVARKEINGKRLVEKGISEDWLL
jgi:hypothetical protein